MTRQRADVLVVEQGLAESRNRAQSLILSGVVLDQHDNRIEKPGQNLDAAIELHLKGQPLPYVSRGGLKLAHALDTFSVSISERLCLDVGASTGGFTDCLLQRGAARVFALDVGYNQLAWRIREDTRVEVLERTNIRKLSALPGAPAIDVVVVDVSFISLRTVIPHALRLCTPESIFVALVKPQFEVGRQNIGKGGIVRDPEVRSRCLTEMQEFWTTLGFSAMQSTNSPITGTKGNHEFLLSGMAPKKAQLEIVAHKADSAKLSR